MKAPQILRLHDMLHAARRMTRRIPGDHEALSPPETLLRWHGHERTASLCPPRSRPTNHRTPSSLDNNPHSSRNNTAGMRRLPTRRRRAVMPRQAMSSSPQLPGRPTQSSQVAIHRGILTVSRPRRRTRTASHRRRRIRTLSQCKTTRTLLQARPSSSTGDRQDQGEHRLTSSG